MNWKSSYKMMLTSTDSSLIPESVSILKGIVLLSQKFALDVIFFKKCRNIWKKNANIKEGVLSSLLI